MRHTQLERTPKISSSLNNWYLHSSREATEMLNGTLLLNASDLQAKGGCLLPQLCALAGAVGLLGRKRSLAAPSVCI